MTARGVEVRAELRQIKSMVDHTYNVTLNIPEDCLEQVKVMMGWLGDEVGVIVVNEPDSRELTDDGKRRKR